eukprot:gnl/TRDRNA2_/TRDRNA2_165028_c0_seq3.p1 gnl/TRDRNA2_/TRDRNA2_165028_c0~~gnl/TRDRNA2_/TRDRNA2_165028_c0_seq3.p1  ORF type:complete len:715 (-),score=129.48 gnl/TRDRNA2_/TRDRNA2_165028_c0_seq3:45-2189(-)
MIRAGAARRSASGLLAPTASTTRMPWEEKDVEGTEMLDQQWKAIEEELQKAEKRAQIWNQRMEHLPTFISDVTHEAVDHMKKDVQDLSQHGVSKRNSFQVLVLTAIFANTLTMGLEVDMPEQADFFYVCEIVFLVIFLLEMAFKLRDERLRYFTSIWNLFDFFLVMMSLVNTCILQPVVGSVTIARKSSMLRILRLVRIVRMVRLLKTFKELVIIIKGITSSVRTIGWVTLLLVILLYVVAIICTTVIGQEEDMYDYQEEVQIKFNNYQYFGSIPRSMYTLFNIVILAEWPEIGRAVIEKQAHIFPVFLFFIIFSAFGLTNVVIGVIVQNMTDAAAEVENSANKFQALGNLKVMKRVHDLIYNIDNEHGNLINYHNFQEAWHKNPEVADSIQSAISLPRNTTASECFDLLDSNGDGELTGKEFMLNTFRINDGNPMDIGLLSLIAVHRNTKLLRQVQQDVHELLHAVNPDRFPPDELEFQRKATPNSFHAPSHGPKQNGSEKDATTRSATAPAEPAAQDNGPAAPANRLGCSLNSRARAAKADDRVGSFAQAIAEVLDSRLNRLETSIQRAVDEGTARLRKDLLNSCESLKTGPGSSFVASRSPQTRIPENGSPPLLAENTFSESVERVIANYFQRANEDDDRNLLDAVSTQQGYEPNLNDTMGPEAKREDSQSRQRCPPPACANRHAGESADEQPAPEERPTESIEDSLLGQV